MDMHSREEFLIHEARNSTNNWFPHKLSKLPSNSAKWAGKFQLLTESGEHYFLQLFDQIYSNSDLGFGTGIFMECGNWKAYLILNLSLSLKQKRFLSTLGCRNITKEVKAKSARIARNFRKIPSSWDRLSNICLEYCSRRDKETYKRQCEFRNPQSSIYLTLTPGWDSQEDEGSIDYA